MATQTLTQTTQPGTETKKPTIFGGFDEFVERSFELITKGTGDFTTESSSSQSLSYEPRVSIHSGEAGGNPTTSFGNQTEIKFNDLSEYQYKQTLKFVKQIDSNVAQVTASHNIELQVKNQVNGMSDEEFAKEAEYNNPSYRGENLRSKPNILLVGLKVLTRMVEALKPAAAKGFEIVRARGRINHATNKNSAAERGGGQTSVFDTPG